MNVPAPMPTIITDENQRAAQAIGAQPRRRDDGRPRRRRRHGDHALPGRNARTARRTIAVVCAVRHTITPMITSVSAAVAAPASGHLERHAGRRGDEQTRAETAAATTPNVVGRRCVLTRSERPAAAVFFGERADVEPGPAADEDAHVVIVRPPVVDLDRADGARPAEPVGKVREDAVGRRPASRSRSSPR